MNVDRLWQRAQRYLAENQPTAARIALESLLARNPAYTPAHLTLGGIAWKEDRIRDAARHALDALREPPADPQLQCDIVAALTQVGEIVAARSLLYNSSLESSASVQVLMRLSGVCQQWGEHPRALEFLKRARKAGANDPDFHCYFGVQLAFNGCLSEAESSFDTCLNQTPSAGRAALMLSRLRKQTPQRNHLARLGCGIKTSGIDPENRASLHFALYKELEDLGRYNEAWAALAHGNAIMHSQLRHSTDADLAALRQLTGVCDRNFLRPEEKNSEGPQPIFIVGLPRSGTTLLERILGNHPDIASAGELGDFARQLSFVANHHSTLPLDGIMADRLRDVDFAKVGQRYLAQSQWRAGSSRFYIDKLPSHWSVTGLLHRALPQALILHLTRAAQDVCFSNYRAMLGDAYAYSYDQTALATHYWEYRRVMAHWHAVLPGRIIDVDYADLVRDPESTARKVFAFCGLAYQPGCADLKRNATAVATLSMAQVRTEIHAAREDWRPYEAQLEPLFVALANNA